MVYSKLKAFLIIAIATLLVSGSALSFYLFFHFQRYLHGKNALIHTIVQTGPRYEQLPTLALAELLDLSYDKKTNIYDFDTKSAKEKLFRTHIFKELEIKKLVPNTLFIDYTLKEGIATLGEMSNTLVDREGSLFPNLPFYTPQKLPSLFLNIPLPKDLWGKTLPKRKMEVLLNILDLLKNHRILEIDLSAFDDPSLGRREIVVTLQVQKSKRVLRLETAHYKRGLEEFLALEKTVLLKPELSHIIDLRIPLCGYIRETNL